MVEVIPLNFGVTFKRVFKQPEVFSAFANDVLDININIDSVDTEYQYPEPIGFVKTGYDLFAEDKDQRIIVEIQHVKEEDFFGRFLYYHLIGLVEQVRSYAEYNFAKTVYTIVVLTSVPRDNSINFGYAVSDMNPIDETGETVDVYPHKLVFLNPRLASESTPPKVREWLDLIADSLDGEVDETSYQRPLFQQIIHEIEQDAITPEELSRIKDEAAWEKAKERFAREGSEDGLEEGREEGREEQRKLMAIGLLQQGVDIAIVMNVTGFTAEEIEKLKSSSA